MLQTECLSPGRDETQHNLLVAMRRQQHERGWEYHKSSNRKKWPKPMVVDNVAKQSCMIIHLYNMCEGAKCKPHPSINFPYLD